MINEELVRKELDDEIFNKEIEIDKNTIDVLYKRMTEFCIKAGKDYLTKEFEASRRDEYFEWMTKWRDMYERRYMEYRIKSELFDKLMDKSTVGVAKL